MNEHDMTKRELVLLLAAGIKCEA